MSLVLLPRLPVKGSQWSHSLRMLITNGYVHVILDRAFCLRRLVLRILNLFSLERFLTSSHVAANVSTLSWLPVRSQDLSYPAAIQCLPRKTIPKSDLLETALLSADPPLFSDHNISQTRTRRIDDVTGSSPRGAVRSGRVYAICERLIMSTFTDSGDVITSSHPLVSPYRTCTTLDAARADVATTLWISLPRWSRSRALVCP